MRAKGSKVKSLKRKIRSNSGVTILIALVFFLLCAVVGAAVLSASSAAAGRVIDADVNEQAYYTIASAARLIRDEIKDQKFEYYEAHQTTGDAPPVTDAGYIAEPPGGSLGGLLANAAMSIYKGTYNEEEGYTDDALEIEVPGHGDSLSKVNGTLRMSADYSIEITLKLGGDEDKYACKLTIPAHQVNTTETHTEGEAPDVVVIVTEETRVAWLEGTIVKNR